MVRLIGGLVAATALHLVLVAPALAQESGAAAGSPAIARDTTGTADAPVDPASPPADGAAMAPGAQPDASAFAAEPATGSPDLAATPAATDPAADPAVAAAEAERARRIVDACMLPPIKLATQEVEDFLANPSSLLATYGTQSFTLSNRVRSLAGSDGRTLEPILALAQNATEDQKAGIGSGLGRTAFLCQGTNPDYAAEIQSQIAQITSPGLLTAFLTATNDMQVAAIGAGGTSSGFAGAPGLSGGGQAGPGTRGSFDDATVANLVNPFATRGGGTVRLGDSDRSDININIFTNVPVSPTAN